MRKEFVRALVGNTSYTRGEQLYRSKRVGRLNISIDGEAMIITVEADVADIMRRNVEAHVRAVLDLHSNWLIDASCTCQYYRMRHANCEHIAAVLIRYAEEFPISSAAAAAVRKTDPAVRNLIGSLSAQEVFKVPKSPVLIEPHIVREFRSSHTMNVYFKAGCRNEHMYVLQNITVFCDQYRNHEAARFGKNLEFTPSKKTIDASCHPLMEFLLDLTSGEDRYMERDSSYYYSYFSAETSPKRNLYLKGKYLDRFMDAVRDIPVYLDHPYTSGGHRASFSTGMPEIVSSMKKDGKGYVFRGSVPPYCLGHDYYYFPDYERSEISRLYRNDDSFEKVMDFLSADSGAGQYIAEADLPAFARYVYPLISSRTKFTGDGFDPYDYAPLKPSFEIYLDSPQNDMITGELYAVYGNRKYNLLEGVSSENRRDKEAEQEMDRFVTGWFNSFDNVNRKLALLNDESKMYDFLKEGIPAMQERAAVFISDALKKLTVRPSPKVTVGVSVSHDLLQLDLVSDDIDQKQLAEILSRYDRKKKYYRLKSGEFIDAGSSLDDLYRLSEELAVSPNALAGNQVSIPEYRAYYLDMLADEGLMEIERDMKFRDLITKVKDTDRRHYSLPKGLQAEMRPYQTEGFEWLCRLNDNHFGALLADEMGLGKTLQVIAFIGSLQKRERVLIVCPASLVYNWSSEIRRFMPSLHSRMIVGSAPARKAQILDSEKDEILITSYDLLKRDAKLYEDMHFTCEVIDEAQYIKNAGTQAARAVKAISASFRIALTGTPIENRLSELWSIFDYLMPGFLFSYARFREMYEIPIVRDNDAVAEETVRKMITPFVLRRLKKDVLKDLPEKLEEVYYAQLEGEQKQLYDAHVRRLKLQLEKETDEEFKENKIAVLAELTKLRQLCCNPSLIYDHYPNNSAKTDLCIDMIRNAVEAGHKVLLFSQFTSMLDILTAALDHEKIRYHLLTGSTPAAYRAQMVASFAEDDIPVFCISLKAGGTGLNLTAADIVIHYDPWWNTAVENQASDRAHRIGQVNIVTVYRLIMKDTIEERILQLQQEKSGLADRILSGEGISSASLSREDLLQLL